MAIIQNQKIIQKLVDELELYPALDKIPTELAEKILPVFQINTEDVSINIKENLKQYQDAVANIQDKRLTVPDDKNWKILSGNLIWVNAAVAEDRFITVRIYNKAGDILYQISNETATSSGHTHCYNFVDMVSMTSAGVIFEQIADGRMRMLPFPIGIRLLEGSYVRVTDYGTGVATDDCTLTLIVDEQDA